MRTIELTAEEILLLKYVLPANQNIDLVIELAGNDLPKDAPNTYDNILTKIADL